MQETELFLYLKARVEVLISALTYVMDTSFMQDSGQVNVSAETVLMINTEENLAAAVVETMLENGSNVFIKRMRTI